ncbi:MAG: hypothetical protein ACRDHZ_01650 [Ktedonobacteraceae bacterium]
MGKPLRVQLAEEGRDTQRDVQGLCRRVLRVAAPHIPFTLMGMQPYAPHVGRRYTFWLDVIHSPEFLVQGYQRGLAEWQQSHEVI